MTPAALGTVGMGPAGMGPALPEVRVRRCTVHVRRHDGWSWGDPASYIPAVTAAIEEALRRAVTAAGVPTDADVRLAEPVRLEVTAAGVVTPASLAELASALRNAAAAAPAPAPADQEQPAPRAVATAEPDGVVAMADDGVAGTSAIAATLARWSTTGRVAEIVRHWPRAVLEAWRAALRSVPEHPAVPTAALPGDAVAAIAESVLQAGAAAADGRDRAERFLILAAAVAATGGGVPPDRSTLALVERHVGRPGAIPALGTAEGGAPAPRVPEPRATAVADPGSVAAAGPAVVPGLPFLVLVQLYRLGFFPAATAAVAAAGILPAANCIAAAAAGKVLDPPDHGWRRTPEQRRAVALAAAIPQGAVDPVLASLADSAELVCAPLRAAVVDLYAGGRSRWGEVQRTRAQGDVLLGEAAGLLPIAWCGTPDEAAEVLSQLGEPPVCDSEVFASFAGVLREHRAVPGRSVPDLERTFGAAVGTALGSLAQEVWGADADALLALDRLRDLEVRVAGGDGVRIGVPRGQRWLDLRRADLLAAWPVPWAPGGWELVTW